MHLCESESKMLRLKFLFLLPLVVCVTGQGNGIGYYGTSNVRDQRRPLPSLNRPRPLPLPQRPVVNRPYPTPLPSVVQPAPTPAYVPPANGNPTYAPVSRPVLPLRPQRQPPAVGLRLPAATSALPVVETSIPETTASNLPASPDLYTMAPIQPEKEPVSEESAPQLSSGPVTKPEITPVTAPEAVAQPVPLPEPKPEPLPEPKPKPITEPQPEIISEPQPDITSEPQPEIISEPQPEPITEPQPIIFSEPQPEPIPEPQPEPILEPQPEIIPEPQPESFSELPEPQTEPPHLVVPISDSSYVKPYPVLPLQPEPQPIPDPPEVGPQPDPIPMPIPPPPPGISSGALLPLRPKPKPVREPDFGRFPTPRPEPVEPSASTEPEYVTQTPPATVSTYAPRPISSSQTPGRPVGSVAEGFKCDKGDGYYAVNNECDAYVQCKINVAIKYYCPDGLHFKPNAKRFEYPCAYPSEVKCAAGKDEQNPRPTDQCPRQYGYFAMDGDCSKFIMCQDGAATVMDCPAGLVFNAVTASCDWVANVPQCNPNVFKDYSCPIAPIEEDGSVSDIIYKYKFGQQCKLYIACQRGYPRLLSCEHGLAFDEASQSCIDDEYVQDCPVLY